MRNDRRQGLALGIHRHPAWRHHRQRNQFHIARGFANIADCLCNRSKNAIGVRFNANPVMSRFEHSARNVPHHFPIAQDGGFDR